jgi:hypothetical protein
MFMKVKGSSLAVTLIPILVVVIYYMLIFYPFTLLFPSFPFQYLFLAPYGLYFFYILNNKRIGQSMLFAIYIRIFSDYPLLIGWYVISHVFDGVLCVPLCSIIDDDICVGPVPLTQLQVQRLHSSPFDIRFVVNVCAEYKGPLASYMKFDPYLASVK